MSELNFDLDLDEISTEETTEVAEEVEVEATEEDIETVEDVSESVEETETTEDVDESIEETTDYADFLNELKSRVKYMDKEVDISSIDEVVENYQKGLDYKRQVDKKERLENQLKSYDALVKQLYPDNIKSTEQLLEALVQHEMKLIEQQVADKYDDEKDRMRVLKGDDRYNTLKGVKPVKFETEVEVEKFNQEVQEINKTYGERFDTYTDLPEDIRELAASKGLSLSEAYKLKNFDKIIENKLNTTKKSLIAELSEGKKKTLPDAKKGSKPSKDYFTLEQIESMSDKQIADNYEKVMRSYERLRKN